MHLPNDLERFIGQQVAEGTFQSADSVIEAGLRTLQKQIPAESAFNPQVWLKESERLRKRIAERPSALTAGESLKSLGREGLTDA